MADDNRDSDRNPLGAFDVFDLGLSGLSEMDALEDLGRDLWSWTEGATPDPDEIDSALSGLPLPDGTELDVDSEVLPNADLGGAEVDRVVETGGEAVEIAVEGTGEAGTVLIDTGSEVVGVAVEGGGEAAAETTGKLIAAALEGV